MTDFLKWRAAIGSERAQISRRGIARQFDMIHRVSQLIHLPLALKTRSHNSHHLRAARDVRLDAKAACCVMPRNFTMRPLSYGLPAFSPQLAPRHRSDRECSSLLTHRLGTAASVVAQHAIGLVTVRADAFFLRYGKMLPFAPPRPGLLLAIVVAPARECFGLTVSLAPDGFLA